MNFKNLFKTTMAVVFGSLMLTACGPEEKPVTPTNVSTADGVALVGNCKKSDMSASVMSWSNGAVAYGASTKITSTKLGRSGTHIVGVRAYIPTQGTDFHVFAGEDYENPTHIKSAEWQDAGWQYVLFDEPLEIAGAEAYYVGYKVTSETLALEQASSSSDLIYSNGAWGKVSEVAGKAVWALQAIVAGGDLSAKTQVDMAVDAITCDAIWKMSGDNVPVTALVRNNGVKTISDVVVTATLGSNSVPVTITDSLMNGQSARVAFEGLSANGEGAVTLKVSVNVTDDKTSSNNSASSVVRVYTDKGVARNTILLEQFTSQNCGYCPNGATILKSNIENMTDPSKFTWVAHHSGFGTDNFTLLQSDTISDGLMVSGAPMGSINRLIMDLEGEGPALNWYLGTPSGELLDALVSEPGQSTLSFTHTYVAATGAVEVNVEGVSSKENTYVTVLIVQDGLMDSQKDYINGNHSSYSHDRVPRLFLTPAKGTKATLDDDGKFNVTVSGTIPASVGKFATVAEDMDVIVIVNGDLDGKAYERYVYNADHAALVTAEPAAAIQRVLNSNNFVSSNNDALFLSSRNICVAE